MQPIRRHLIWPVVAQIPLAIASYSILLQSYSSQFEIDNLLWKVILGHGILLVSASLLNLAIYKSDKFAKAFRIIFFLPMVGIMGLLGVISFIPYGPLILTLAKGWTYGAMALAYLTASCLPLALTKKYNSQPHIKDTVKWGIILILVFTITSALAFRHNISISRTLSKERNSYKNDLVKSGYKVLKGFGYVPHGYKVLSEEFYAGGLIAYLECEGKEDEDDFGVNYVSVLQYKPGQLKESLSGGSSWVPISDQYRDRSRVETEWLTIFNKKVKHETVLWYVEEVYEKRGEYGMEYESVVTDNIARIEARLIWEDSGLITEIHGDTLYQEGTYNQTMCSVDKEKMVKIAESLRYFN